MFLSLSPNYSLLAIISESDSYRIEETSYELAARGMYHGKATSPLLGFRFKTGTFCYIFTALTLSSSETKHVNGVPQKKLYK